MGGQDPVTAELHVQALQSRRLSLPYGNATVSYFADYAGKFRTESQLTANPSGASSLVSVVPADRYSSHALEHLDDGRAVLFVQPGGAAYLVDLLAQTGHQQRHSKRLGVAGFQFLVLVRNVDRAARREVASEHARHPVLELDAIAGADA